MAFYETGRWFPWRRIVTKTVQESPEKLFRGSICLYNGWQETTKFSEFSLMAFLLSPCRLFAHVSLHLSLFSPAEFLLMPRDHEKRRQIASSKSQFMHFC
ncbi:hypothetical protein NC653_017786 [Populus alba x Populus x berolinensis]|uniref:Uncharacterized protein n=1 Tax=Populus alba x Populus x berolinensis TaxID=444605 RepID=A0AAD6W1F2_9ROSI|nr:hypothetical protein NC653_017786 [Populus alba x Populus x berolinensis]